MSLHKKDWLKLLGGAALLATGAGAAGIGPLAGLLGGEAAAGAGAAGAAGAGEAATAALAGEGALGAGATEGLLATGATEAALPTAAELAAADIGAGASTELGAGSFSGAQGGLDLSGLLKSGATAGAKGAAGAAGAQGVAHGPATLGGQRLAHGRVPLRSVAQLTACALLPATAYYFLTPTGLLPLMRATGCTPCFTSASAGARGGGVFGVLPPPAQGHGPRRTAHTHHPSTAPHSRAPTAHTRARHSVAGGWLT